LGSPILYQLGLLAALESLGEQWQAQHPQIQVRVEVTTQPVSLENETAIVLFRVIRELLRNIEKHAQSRHVSIMVGKDNGHLSIIVEDDGRGFRPTQATGQHPSIGGFGLLSITEQVKSIGGHVEVETTLGQGTRTVVQAPLLVEEPENQRTNGKEQKPRSRTLRNS
jgi:signal transduction histidine kinase